MRRAFGPLSNPLSPLKLWSDFRIRRYYRRTLGDRELARNWDRHYLGDLNLPERAAVLDHGCGRGRHAGLLVQLGFRTAAQDVFESDWWQHLPAVAFQVACEKWARLPWQSSVFDLMVDVGVLGLLSERALNNLSGEANRVLKPGGYWLVVEANPGSYGHRYFQQPVLDVKDVLSAAKQRGFVEIDVRYEGFQAPIFPVFFDFLRKQCSPRPFSGYDWDSWLSDITPPERRTVWVLRMQKSPS